MDWKPTDDEEEEREDKPRKRAGRGGGRPPKAVVTARVPKKSKCTHAEARRRVCIVCIKYFSRDANKKGTILTNDQQIFNMLCPFLFEFPYNCNDPRVPVFLCHTCATAVRAASSRNFLSCARVDICNEGRGALVQRWVGWRNFVCPGVVCPLCRLAVSVAFGGKNLSVRRQPAPVAAAAPVVVATK